MHIGPWWTCLTRIITGYRISRTLLADVLLYLDALAQKCLLLGITAGTSVIASPFGPLLPYSVLSVRRLPDSIPSDVSTLKPLCALNITSLISPPRWSNSESRPLFDTFWVENVVRAPGMSSSFRNGHHKTHIKPEAFPPPVDLGWVWVPFPPPCGFGCPLVDEESVAAHPGPRKGHPTLGGGGGGAAGPGPGAYTHIYSGKKLWGFCLGFICRLPKYEKR